ncbi:hypothetical protein FC83_GL000776 [Agrilactobacillus composti DSM 18527 = JCM 14202]|uniref:Uncharacterized protein n=1 Tax=Agrilactobacillus composti DSM 18527 = JCM 14202 TaxID=1423734 RepID=X0PE00_9LACO|nr:hypothetical protein [Agrilactobacillus composti]KRM35749.1 hypothetical protein FC83_GL000776 [Agrilactobacillus composti DSM 18527 = JCM 14202]GAF39609.1 hypothetical protein JCM14202_1476 [Agrilactobacillus composti DSM 18527 = JCM 14202]
MSQYRSQKLLDRYGLTQAINTEFVLENMQVLSRSDYSIIAEILDKQISWEYAQQHLHTVWVFLTILESISAKANQTTDLLLARLSKLYLFDSYPALQYDSVARSDLFTAVQAALEKQVISKGNLQQAVQNVHDNFPVKVLPPENDPRYLTQQLLDTANR